MIPFEYLRTGRFFAQVSEDVKDIGIRELSENQARNIEPGYAGIYFSADKADFYRIHYTTRILTRILAPLAVFTCRDKDDLYSKIKQLAWPEIFSVNNSFAVFANVSNHPNITHSHYASLCLKDAVADHFQQRFGKRPSVDTRTPDLWINLHVRENQATVSLDTSGGSLHRRGYRTAQVEAPMQENLAAAIIELSEWDGSRPLYDPMCGSGTLISEALMRYCRIPAGILRKHYGLGYLPDFDAYLWQNVVKKVNEAIRPLPVGLIGGSDISARALAATQTNLQNLPFGGRIQLEVKAFEKIRSLTDSIIVTNRPYGIRLGEKSDAEALHESFGNFLKQRCRGSVAYVYFGDPELIKKVGLKPKWRMPLSNGGLDGRLVKYEIF
jgi:putative N6-adenine-specific DNA methylase